MASSDLAPSRTAPVSPDVLAKARILLADDQMKTVRRLQKLAKKRGLTEASLVKEHPQLADWLADGRR